MAEIRQPHTEASESPFRFTHEPSGEKYPVGIANPEVQQWQLPPESQLEQETWLAQAKEAAKPAEEAPTDSPEALNTNEAYAEMMRDAAFIELYRNDVERAA